MACLSIRLLAMFQQDGAGVAIRRKQDADLIDYFEREFVGCNHQPWPAEIRYIPFWPDLVKCFGQYVQIGAREGKNPPEGSDPTRPFFK
jgi:hypothetical protein